MSISATPSSWPSAIIGVIMAIYWLKVLQMVARTRRTAGRAANLIPPEPLGRLLRLLWTPVVLLWIFIPLLTPFLVNPPALLRACPWLARHTWIGWLAVGFAAPALVLTWVCWIRMGTSWRMGIDPNERTQLVFTGPYAYVRHPIYALSSVLMLTALAAMPSPLMLLVAILHCSLLQWEARREETYLKQLHGQAYSDYAARVGRFLPRMRR